MSDYKERLWISAQKEASQLANQPEIASNVVPDMIGIAIDPKKPDGKLDPEQIISLEWLTGSKTNCRINVGITNIDSVLEDGGFVEQFALLQTTTEYLGENYSRLMMPEELTFGSLALLQGKVRPIILVSFEIDLVNQEITNPEFRLGIGINAKQYSTADVGHALKGKKSEHTQLFKDLYAVANSLKKSRPNGSASGRNPAWANKGQNEGDIINTEIFTVVNQLVADFCHQNSIPAIFGADIHINPNSDHQDDEQSEPVWQQKNFAKHPDRPFKNVRAKITAPAREAICLVNIRNLAAFLKGESYPYSQDSLITYLDLLTYIKPNKTAKHWDAQMIQDFQEQVMNGEAGFGYESLKAKELHLLVVYTGILKQIPEKLKVEVLQRIRMNDIGIDPLLVEKNWKSLDSEFDFGLSKFEKDKNRLLLGKIMLYQNFNNVNDRVLVRWAYLSIKYNKVNPQLIIELENRIFEGKIADTKNSLLEELRMLSGSDSNTNT